MAIVRQHLNNVRAHFNIVFEVLLSYSQNVCKTIDEVSNCRAFREFSFRLIEAMVFTSTKFKETFHPFLKFLFGGLWNFLRVIVGS